MSSLVDAILAVWVELSDWIVSQFANIEGLFWTIDSSGVGSLTFIGTMSCVSIGIGFVFLLLGVVTNFFKLRS